MNFPERQAIFMHESQNAKGYRISVKPLLYRPGEKKEICLTIDAETAAQYGLACQALPEVEGMLENQAGVLFLRYHVSCTPDLECDRCLSPVRTPIAEDFSHVVVTQTASEQNDSEYLLASDAMLDLAIVVFGIVLGCCQFHAFNAVDFCFSNDFQCCVFGLFAAVTATNRNAAAILRMSLRIFKQPRVVFKSLQVIH